MKEHLSRPDEESPLLSLPFDHYERYALTQRIVSLLWPRRRDHPLRILDVGGHSSSLKHFLPGDEVVLADLQCPPPFTYREGIPFLYDAYFLAAGGQLPFRNGSFDLVTALDTLEHVPNDLRPSFLRDLSRVASRFLILNGPEFHSDAAHAEQRLAVLLERTGVGENVSLNEHLDLGLPDRESVESVLREQGLPFASVPNGNLTLWLSMMGVKHYIMSFPHSDGLHEAIDRIYNTAVSPGDFGGLCYRRAYVIAKRPGDAEVLRRIETTFADDLSKPAPIWNLQAVEKVLETMGDHAWRVRRDLAELRDLLAQRDAALQQTDSLLLEKDSLLAENQALLAETEGQLREVAQQYQLATSTLGFRLLERARRVVNRALPSGTRRRALFIAFARGADMILSRGWGTFLRRLLQVWRWVPRLFALARPAQPGASLNDQYQLWLQAHALTPARTRAIRGEEAGFSYRPKVSIIMPVYNTDPTWLREAIESVRTQLYDNWELCIGDDGSTKAAVRTVLENYARAEKRIRVAYLEENRGISAASEQALALATGEYVGFLDHDDELKPDALYEVVKLLNEHPELDFIYSDEDKRRPDGRLVEPFFKPDWSPDLLLSTNYVTHFAVYRKRIVDEVGGLRSQCDFSQDYDLALRVTERTEHIGHIPRPLYTWRMIPGSAASELEAKPRAAEAAGRALADAMQRRGIQAQVTDGLWSGTYRITYQILGEPLVSIIVPTKDQVRLLARCIDSIRRKTGYKNYEILVVDNGSIEESTNKYLKGLAQQPGIRVLDYPQPFNFSSINNFAAQCAQGEHLIFLNNDTEVIGEEWLSAMLEHSQRPEVGAVGARLLYADGRLQHGGVVVGLGGVAGHANKLLPKGSGGYFARAKVIQNLSAVTAACLMMRADLFADLGGFDEEHLAIAFGDVDMCLRIRERGLLVVWTPYAELYHHESASRGYEDTPEKQQRFAREIEYVKARWGDRLLNDPYYNPNLTLDREDFSLRV